VALIGTMLTRRVLHHMEMFGQAMDPGSPQFAAVSMGLARHVQSVLGGSMAEAGARVKALLGGYVSQQAFVEAINDDFLIAAGITLLGVIPILFLRIRKRKQGGGHTAAVE
jgi:DHA2 family multidrug resistance protein